MIYEIRKPIPVPPNAPLNPKSVIAPYQRQVGIETVATVTDQFRDNVAPDLNDLMRRQMVRHAASLGHEVTDVALRWVRELPEQTRRHFPTMDPVAPVGTMYVIANATAPGFPQAYPMCGDWYCDDSADWDAFDPLVEPDEFKWARVERRIIESAPNSHIAEEMLRMRRDHQAGGRPLWTLASAQSDGGSHV